MDFHSLLGTLLGCIQCRSYHEDVYLAVLALPISFSFFRMRLQDGSHSDIPPANCSMARDFVAYVSSWKYDRLAHALTILRARS